MLLMPFCTQKCIIEMHFLQFQILDPLPIPKGYLSSTRGIICRVDTINELNEGLSFWKHIASVYL